MRQCRCICQPGTYGSFCENFEMENKFNISGKSVSNKKRKDDNEDDVNVCKQKGLFGIYFS